MWRREVGKQCVIALVGQDDLAPQILTSSAGVRDIHPSWWGGKNEPVAQLGGLCTHQAGPRARPSCIVFQFVLGQPVVSTQGGVLGFSTTSTVVYWLCVFASLSVVQLSDYWSER